MSKKPAKRTAHDLGELLLLGSALWLGLRGKDPREIAARAEYCADRARALLEALERAADEHLRGAAGCRAPQPCDCLMCIAERDPRL